MLTRILRFVPRPLRHTLIRRQCTYARAPLADCVLRVANCTEDYLAAFRLVHESYVDRGWIEPQPGGLWITMYHVLPESTVYVMTYRNKYIGTVSIITDSDIKLPIDHTWASETQGLRAAGARLGEIGSLALSKGYRRTGLGHVLMASVWRMVWARQIVTDFLIAVSSEVEDYYRAIFNFEVYGPVRPYRGFAGASAAPEDDLVIGLRQRLDGVHEFCRRHYPKTDRRRFNLRLFADEPYPASFEQPVPTDVYTADFMRYKLPRQVFQELFMKHTNLIARLDPLTRQHLARYRTAETLEHKAISPQEASATFSGISKSSAIVSASRST